jgi:hypothetical protein
MSGPSTFFWVGTCWNLNHELKRCWQFLAHKKKIKSVAAVQTDPSSLPSRPQNMSNLVWACATVMYKDEARGEEEVFQWLFHSGG